MADHSGALSEVPKDHVEDEKDPTVVVEVDTPHFEGERPKDELPDPSAEPDPATLKGDTVLPHAEGELPKDELPTAKEEVDPASLKEEAPGKVDKAEKVEDEEDTEAKKEEKDKDVEPAATFLSVKEDVKEDVANVKEQLAANERSEKKKVSPMRTK